MSIFLESYGVLESFGFLRHFEVFRDFNDLVRIVPGIDDHRLAGRLFEARVGETRIRIGPWRGPIDVAPSA